MKTNNNSKATILCQKAEELLRKHAPENALKLSEKETLKLIQKLKDNQMKMIKLKKELKLAKEQTQIAIKKYTELYDLTPLGYFTLSKEGEIIELDLNGANMLGKERTHLINCRFGFLVSADTKATFNHFIASVFSGKVKETCEVILSTDGNLPIYVHLVGSVTENAEQCYVIAVDITGRKQAEEKIRIEQENMKAIFASAPVGMLLIDEETMIVNSNAVIARMVNKEHGQIIRHLGGSGLGCVHSFEDERECGFSPACPECNLRKGIDQVLKSGISIHGAEIPYSVLINGQENRLWLNVNAEPVLLNGRKHVVVAIDDITGRKQMEEELRSSEELYRSLFDNMLNGFAYCRMLYDRGQPSDFIYLGVNGAFEVQTGLKNVVGKKVSEVIPGIRESDPKLLEIYGRVASTGKPEEFEMYVAALQMWFSISVYSPAKDHFVAVFDVITGRKRAEEALKLFRSLVEQSNDAIEVIDPATGRFIDANEKACTELGYSREELLSLKVPDIDPMVDESMFQTIVEELQKSGSKIFESQHRRKDGSNFPVEINVKYVCHEGNYLVSVARDITERKRAEEQLQLFRRLLDQSADAIFIVDATTSRFLDVNEQACLNMQYSREELLQRGVLDIQTAMRNTIDWQAHIEELRAKGKLLIEFEALRKDGTCFPVEVNTQFIETEGKMYIISMVRDITERKRAEETILKANRLYAVISQINQTIVRTDDRDKLFAEVCRIAIEYGKFQMSWIGLVDEKTKFVNPVSFAGIEEGYLSKMSKISVSDTPDVKEPTGSAIREVKYFVCDDIANDPGMAPWKDEALKRGYRSSIALPIKPFGKVIGAFSLYAPTPHFFDQTEIAVLNEVSNDITFALETIETEKKRVEAEEELIRAKEKAEESDRLKSAFLTNISHEIRTPMNGILGFAEILKTPDLTGEQQQEYIITMEKCGARMLNIIDDIVDLSKIESGQIKVSVSETNVNEKIIDIYNFFKPDAEQKGLQIYYKNALPDNEAIIKTGRSKLFSILTNLVKNAIKFTKEGFIEIGYNLHKTDPHPEFLFYVKDTGIGIPQENINIIFERFRQVGESLSRDYQGAGLGLAISKAYVEMLGGKIWVESEEGKGSTFYFTVPIFLNHS